MLKLYSSVDSKYWMWHSIDKLYVNGMFYKKLIGDTKLPTNQTSDGCPIFDSSIKEIAALERFVCFGELETDDLDEFVEVLDYYTCVSFDVLCYSHLPDDYRRIKIVEAWHKLHGESLLVRVGDGQPLENMPDNMFIAGSAALNQYHSIEPEPNDIDIFTGDGKITDFMRWLDRYRSDHHFYFYTGRTIVNQEYHKQNKDIQFILTSHRSVQDCLLSFDLDCCKFAVTNDGLWATPSALWAVEHRANYIELDGLSDMNLSRITKYRERGFEPLAAIDIELLPADKINAYSMIINVPDELKEFEMLYFEPQDDRAFYVTVLPREGVCRMAYKQHRYFSHDIKEVRTGGTPFSNPLTGERFDLAVKMLQSIFPTGHKPMMQSA